MSGKVSVVIPAYNSGNYIIETINSILNQTYDNVEILVVDDGSKDNTKEVVFNYHPKVRYIVKQNGGPASARNLGIKEADGEFIAFLDADDLWANNKLEKQLKCFEDDKVGLVYACVQKVDENNEELADHVKRNRYEGEIFKQLFLKNFIATSTVVARKECFEKLGSFREDPDYISVEDYDMWLRIAAGYKIGFVDEKLVRYRVHENNISKNLTRSYFGEKKVLEGIREQFSDQGEYIQSIWKSRMAKLYYELALDYFISDQFTEARKYFGESLKYKRINLKALGYYFSTLLGKNWIGFYRKAKGKRN